MRLIEALRLSERSSIAFVGAGGKTTALFRVARELLASSNIEVFKTIIATTTTHLGAWQSKLADHFLVVHTLLDIEKIENAMPEGLILVTVKECNDRLPGLEPELLEKVRILAENNNCPLLIEADGSHYRPLKAPAQYEPAIPDFVQLVVVVAGLKGLGKPLTNQWVHRPEIFSELAGLPVGNQITHEALVKVLLNTNGGLKNIPSNARKVILLNQVDSLEARLQAETISEKLIPQYQSVVIGSISEERRRVLHENDTISKSDLGILAVIEQIGGIILAAGGSRRFGKPKQLLKWKEQPFIRLVAKTALQAGLSPVVIVVGSSAQEIMSTIDDLPVCIIINGEWAMGLSTSIKLGLTALPKDIGGAVFLQADQPHIPYSLIKNLVKAHETTLNPIIAPQINGQRGNPVLFDRNTFKKLNSIEGDMGGRVLFEQYAVQWEPWNDPNLLLDIDTPEDYQAFLRIYPEHEVTL